jgi:hypothetical protein
MPDTTGHLVTVGKDDSRLRLGGGTRSVGGEGEPRGGRIALPLSLHHAMESEAACSSAPDGPPPVAHTMQRVAALSRDVVGAEAVEAKPDKVRRDGPHRPARPRQVRHLLVPPTGHDLQKPIGIEHGSAARQWGWHMGRRR